MKTIIYFTGIFLLILSFQSCIINGGGKSVVGNKAITQNKVAISDYKKIDFQGGNANIIYEQKTDAAPYLLIEIDENLFPLLTVNTKNGVLYIDHEENIRPTKYNIYTNSTGLENMGLSGSGKVHLKGAINTESLQIKLSGSGKVTGDNITANSVTSKVAGSGDVYLKGKANKIESSISGSGDFNALDMPVDEAVCSVSGSGSFSVHANNYLKIRISGSGRVKYKGHPQIDQSISGSGRLSNIN